MAGRVVYLNSEHVGEKGAKVSVLDRGFRWGDAARLLQAWSQDVGVDIVEQAARHAR